ncbi:creatininase family protein [Verminephrobacter eiseniae]|uniref:creatininase family protein n=1 Tax=Verminephrobacter eiseniae TaxID=364317 RepID=UPI002237969C|nr:creatininase family protein [Verminephrobacter eiseniae]MCW5237922.1 creatininase family protein [Verminephrobacter eiseniae]
MHPPLRSRFWSDLSSQEFSRLDRERLIAVLPLGAIEQHGPHLPMSTDTATIDAMVRASLAHLPDALPVLFLPTLAYGKSNEHARYPGTLTLSASTLIALCKEVGACVARAGVRKLVLYNSHGGQMSVMDIVARDLRQEQSMMVVAANWFTLGLPDGLFAAQELRHGIHAGALESSVMLQIRPGDVHTGELRDFDSLGQTLAAQGQWLAITGGNKLGWQMQDINPAGAAGDATCASAEKGAAVLDHVGRRLAELLHEVDRFPLERLAHLPAWS